MLPAENLNSDIKKFWPKNGPSILEVEKYIKKYSKEKIVIKCGGKVLLDKSLLDSLLEDIAILKKLGLTPILVHGGGLGIKKKLDEQNIQSKFVMGLRVTDDKMIGIVEDVMINFNKKIVKALKAVSSTPIVYYISPQVWAWKENRVLIIKHWVDSLVVLFPFEKSFLFQKLFPSKSIFLTGTTAASSTRTGAATARAAALGRKRPPCSCRAWSSTATCSRAARSGASRT